MPIIPMPEPVDDTFLHYCVNCVDFRSQQRGTFAYDVAKWERGLGHWAISPVFPVIEEFFTWAKENGWKYHKLTHMFVLSKTFE